MIRRLGAVVAGLALMAGCGTGVDDTTPIEVNDVATATLAAPTTTDENVATSDGDPAQPADAVSPAPHSTDSTAPTPPSRNRAEGGGENADKPTPRPKPQPKKKAPSGRYQVLEVVDGDTVKVAYRGGVSVRVIGIDTPEIVHPSQPDECGGQAASAAAHRLLDGQRVNLVFDASQGRTDAYGRMLAYLEIPGTGDFGLTMLRRGHAAEYTYDVAYQRQAQYRAAEAEARSTNKAMWRRCGGPNVPLHKPTPTPEEEPQPAGNCAPGYNPCVPPYPPDVDCADIERPIRVTDDDPHGLDGNHDGVGCTY